MRGRSSGQAMETCKSALETGEPPSAENSLQETLYFDVKAIYDAGNGDWAKGQAAVIENLRRLERDTERGNRVYALAVEMLHSNNQVHPALVGAIDIPEKQCDELARKAQELAVSAKSLPNQPNPRQAGGQKPARQKKPNAQIHERATIWRDLTAWKKIGTVAPAPKDVQPC